MANKWFETVAIAQKRAKRRLPKSVYMALVAGSESGATISDNLRAFRELGFAPHVAGLHGERSMATRVLDADISLPVIISPTGVQGVTPDGELDVARAAAARGTAMGLSSFASQPIENVVAANPLTYFQIYWCGTREQIEQRVERAKRAGAKGLILTLDWSFAYGRDWGSPNIPSSLSPIEMIKRAPEVTTKWGWFFEYAKTFRPPALSVPNMTMPGEPEMKFFDAYGQWMGTPPPTWDDVAWLRSLWPEAPFMLKGICRIDDAREAVKAGVSAISVSNHGGNNIDGTPAAIRVLPSIVDAVGGDVEILLDGGIRRGSDAVKAVAFGATAVMIGRAYLWGLGANGQAGVENVLDIMRSGIDSVLLGLGKSSIDELSMDDVIVPDGFFRTLGA